MLLVGVVCALFELLVGADFLKVGSKFQPLRKQAREIRKFIASATLTQDTRASMIFSAVANFTKFSNRGACLSSRRLGRFMSSAIINHYGQNGQVGKVS